ncbi:PGPGW domain-containing protein [Thalassotalea sp. LPB0316]|uniref:PGPGW domain-containing protein n=1 Tax=Thalassotalea sp. LPB0316 TaxID=2769490 RepID=UPI00299F8AD1|nr:PGPGW domain-containing protein [Thalassotalea sp. LPB0316]
MKKMAVTLIGSTLTLIGAIFILLPGPAFLFLPVGLALLSLEYPWAKIWLKKTQRLMRASAVKLDAWIGQLRRR